MPELYFLASPTRERPNEIGQLVRMKTSVGTPHVAFVTRTMAEEYIAAAGLGLNCTAIAAPELTADIRFDMVRQGVLVIGSRPVMLTLVVDAPSFDYPAHVRVVEVDVVSAAPW